MADASKNGECSESTIELNIKTLQSQMHTFHVDKKITVSSLKEKIEQQLNIPALDQRLIYRGRVLKDEHSLTEYQVENGHTLHLVTRQSSDGANEDPNTNNRSHGVEAGGVPPPPNARVGQISHSVLLGTINVGELGEGVVPDANRVIGAVLNSLGIGSVASGGFGGVQTPPNDAGGPRNVAGNPSISSAPPQVIQIPLNASGTPHPALAATIPDSLTTLRDFMARVEQAQAGQQQPSRPEIPSGSPAEALAVVLRQAERLLSTHITSALSNVAGRLERDGGTSDPRIRIQTQTEASQLGVLLQHLGALSLELGRTTLLLRMTTPPTVNTGPAVYINPSGPNPIMVQPFPWQTSPLLSALNPRQINISIHAGTSAANAGSTSEARSSTTETTPVDSGSAQSVQTRDLTASSPEITIPSQPSSSDAPVVHPVQQEPSNQGAQDSSGASSSANEPNPSAPLGLGLGSLGRKKRVKPPVDSVSSGQEVLRSLAGSSSAGAPVDDAASAVSDALQSPEFDGLLSGISDRIGVGSPNVLRSMMQQLSQNPQIMNTVGRIAQQVDTSGGQPGGFDLSSMMQQMMPIVSQVLGSNVGPTRGGNPRNAVQEAARSIQRVDGPRDIFSSVARAAASAVDGGSVPDDVVADESLVAAYMEMLREDLNGRVFGSPSDGSDSLS